MNRNFSCETFTGYKTEFIYMYFDYISLSLGNYNFYGVN